MTPAEWERWRAEHVTRDLYANVGRFVLFLLVWGAAMWWLWG